MMGVCRVFGLICGLICLTAPVGAWQQPAEGARKAPAAPKSDAEIRGCIIEKLAGAPSLKGQSLTAEVSGGVATLSGAAKNPGSKGAASRIARRCGATSVANNITFPASARTPKPPGKM